MLSTEDWQDGWVRFQARIQTMRSDCRYLLRETLRFPALSTSKNSPPALRQTWGPVISNILFASISPLLPLNVCVQVTVQTSHSCHIGDIYIYFFNISEALDSHQRSPPRPTSGAPPPQRMCWILIHYSRLEPIHIQQSEVNWAASLYNCRDTPSQPGWGGWVGEEYRKAAARTVKE